MPPRPARQSLLEMFNMISTINSFVEHDTVASKHKFYSSKACTISDESGQLRDSRPANEVEVHIIEQTASRFFRHSRRRSGALYPPLLALCRGQVGFQGAQCYHGTIECRMVCGAQRVLEDFRWIERTDYYLRNFGEKLW